MGPSLTHFGDLATQYARDVTEGKIVACKWVKLACQRHLNDLEKSRFDAQVRLAGARGNWPYVFNPELEEKSGKKYYPAERVCRFAELLPHIKGHWAGMGMRIKLEPWQAFCLASIFGWVNRDTGMRRFRIADIIVPRKNGKSAIASVIGLYMLAADGEFGAEVYSGATSEKQAKEVFTPALLMTRATPAFRQKYGVTAAASNLSIAETNSKFIPLIGKPGDGASPSCAIVDEYHEHATPELYDTMKTGMLARRQPLMLVITTAGTTIAGPCYQHQHELQKILDGQQQNDQRFGIIYTIDDDDDWTDPEVLAKANPNFGVSVEKETLLNDLREAIIDPRKQTVFKTKHLDIWSAAASPWLNLVNLQKAGDTSLKLESFKGEACVVGLDLASKKDIASAVYSFKRRVDGQDHYYFISRNYCPQHAVDQPENAHYQAYVNAGHLIATPGDMIDLEFIQEEILKSLEIVVLSEVAKDPWGGHQLGANLAKEGIVVVDIPQVTKYLSEPMKEIEALVDAGRFHHDGNPCYVWQLGNVEVNRNRPNETYFPLKFGDGNKIDAGVATIDAMNRLMFTEPVGSIDGWLRSTV